MSRRVRTPEGAKFYGQPVGSVIERDLPKAFLKPSVDLPSRVAKKKMELGKGWDSDSVELDDGKHVIHRLSKPGGTEKHFFLEKRIPSPRNEGEPLRSSRQISREHAEELHDSMEDLNGFENKDPSEFGDNSVREIVGLLDADFSSPYSKGEKAWIAEATKRAEERKMGIDEWIYGPKALQASGERRVRTPEGEKFYGQPIGSVIVPNVYTPAGLKLPSELKAGDFFGVAGKKFQVESVGATRPQKHGDPGLNGRPITEISVIGEDGAKSKIDLPSTQKVGTYKSSPKGTKARLDLPGAPSAPAGATENGAPLHPVGGGSLSVGDKVVATEKFNARPSFALVKKGTPGTVVEVGTRFSKIKFDGHPDVQQIRNDMLRVHASAPAPTPGAPKAFDLPKKPTLVEQSRIDAQARKKLEAAGFKWNSNMQHYQSGDGVTVQSVAGGEWRVYPKGVSLWTTDESKKQKFDNFADAADAGLKMNESKAPSEVLRDLEPGKMTDAEIEARKAEIRKTPFSELSDAQHIEIAALASEQERRRMDSKSSPSTTADLAKMGWKSDGAYGQINPKTGGIYVKQTGTTRDTAVGPWQVSKPGPAPRESRVFPTLAEAIAWDESGSSKKPFASVHGRDYGSIDEMKRRFEVLNKTNDMLGESDGRVTEANALKAELKKHGAFPAENVPPKSQPAKMTNAERVAAAKQAHVDALKAFHDSGAERGTPEHEAKWNDYKSKLAAHSKLISDLEDAGKGGQIPDDGPTIRVANKAQKILLESELQGQISDGMWENSGPRDHWKDWSNANVIVDPNHLGRNFYPRKDNYNLNSSALLDVVGDRMIEAVQKDGGDPSYDMKKMKADLASLKKIFKTSRPNLVAKKPEPEPSAATVHKTSEGEDVSKLPDGTLTDYVQDLDRPQRDRMLAMDELIKRGVMTKDDRHLATSREPAGPRGEVVEPPKSKLSGGPHEEPSIARAVKSPETKAPSPAFVKGKGTKLGEVNDEAKGSHPERFVPKESFPDGRVPQKGERVRDESGRTGTIAETYQLYTAVNWDDGSKKVVRNNKLNGIGSGTSAPSEPKAEAKVEASKRGVSAKVDGQAKEAERAVKDFISRFMPADTAEEKRQLDYGERKATRLASLRSDLESGKISEAEYRTSAAEELRGMLGEDGPVDGDPISAAFEALSGKSPAPKNPSPAPAAPSAPPSGARELRSPREMADAGVTGKELRDALRRENPKFSNAQAHVVANRMAADAENRLAQARKTPTAPESRKILAARGEAMPDGSFPTPSKLYFSKAVRAVGRTSADKRPAVREYLKKRADALGMAVPDSWNDSVHAPSSEGETQTAKQMAASGIAGKQLRDQLRKENPHFTNAQVHLVSRKMEKQAADAKEASKPDHEGLSPDDLTMLQMQLTPNFPNQEKLTKDALSKASVPQLTTLLQQIKHRLDAAGPQQKDSWQRVLDLVAAEAKKRLGKA